MFGLFFIIGGCPSRDVTTTNRKLPDLFSDRRCNMTRFTLGAVLFGFAFVQMAATKDPASIKPELPKAAPIYVKIIWPVDPATGKQKERAIVESWVSKSVEKPFKADFIAVSEWVPLSERRYEATDIWDGKLDGKERACAVSAVITERKEGRIKILLRGWRPDGVEVAVILDDEPGSREVAPVTEAKTEHGTPHVAVFVGVPSK